MKKATSFLTAVLLVFAAFIFILPQTANADGIIETRFVNPCDIFVDSSGVYVLDKVDSSHSYVHKFNFDATTRTSYEINGAFDKIEIFDNTVYLLAENHISWGTFSETAYTETGSYTESSATATIYADDFVVFEYSPKDRIICLGNGFVYIVRPDTNDKLSIECTNALSCAKHENVFYVLTDSQIKEYRISEGYISSEGNTQLSSVFNNVTLNGIFIFNLDTVYRAATDNATVYDFAGAELFDLLPENSSNTVKTFATYKIDNETVALYEIQSDNKLYRYNVTKDGQYFEVDYTGGFVTGSDTLSITPPALSAINGYTLASSTGYPTNFIYKINGNANSVADAVVLESSQKFIILDYDGADTSDYYFVMYGSQFGYIEKAGGTDTKINQYTTLSAKTAKTNSTHFYTVPSAQEQFRIVGVSRDTQLTITMEFVHGNETWYYATCQYDNVTYSGFIRALTVYDLAEDSLDVPVVTMRVNPPIGQEVTLYSDSLQQTPQKDLDNNDIKLSVGTRVKQISDENGVAYLQVTKNDQIYYGYVSSEYLIKNGITNYFALGLSLLIVAMALTAYLIVITKRRKEHEKQREMLEESEDEKVVTVETTDEDDKKE